MAVTARDTKMSITFKDYERKSLGTFSGIDPLSSVNNIAMFAEGMNELRNDSIERVETVSTSELVEV